MPRKRPPSRVFFPWERRRGLLGRLGRARTRVVLVTALTGWLLVAMGCLLLAVWCLLPAFIGVLYTSRRDVN